MNRAGLLGGAAARLVVARESIAIAGQIVVHHAGANPTTCAVVAPRTGITSPNGGGGGGGGGGGFAASGGAGSSGGDGAGGEGGGAVGQPVYLRGGCDGAVGDSHKDFAGGLSGAGGGGSAGYIVLLRVEGWIWLHFNQPRRSPAHAAGVPGPAPGVSSSTFEPAPRGSWPSRSTTG